MLSLLNNEKLTDADIGRMNFIDMADLPGDAAAFFGIEAAFGGRDGLTKAVHNLAWFWKCPPREVWDCPVDRFLEWVRQSERIEDEIEAARPPD